MTARLHKETCYLITKDEMERYVNNCDAGLSIQTENIQRRIIPPDDVYELQREYGWLI